LILGAWVALLGNLPEVAAKPPAPNVVILFADDLGYGDLGCYGHPTIRTPNLDRMAGEGMRFTEFYSAACVCTPSRAALLTGRYPIRSGMCHDRFRVLRRESTGHLPESEITLAELLRQQGYATACIGKWHLGNFANNPAGHPWRHGFDVFFGLPHSNDMDPTPAAAKGAAGRPDQNPRWWNAPLYRGDSIVERPADQTALTSRTIDEAADFITAHLDQPFFLYVPFSFPHVPLFASADFRGTSPRGLYGDVVEELDAGVGRLLDLLQENDLAERTLVFFTSDNGPWLVMNQQGGSAGVLKEGKGSTWEGGMRVPAIAWWPGHIKTGQVHRGLATALDLLPTCAALCGAEIPQDRPIDGVDISRALEANEEVPREAFFYYRGTQLFAARRGPLKAHFTTRGGYGDRESKQHDPPLLFDLRADPGEQFDVAVNHVEQLTAIIALTERHTASLVPPPSQLVATVKDVEPPTAKADP